MTADGWWWRQKRKILFHSIRTFIALGAMVNWRIERWDWANTLWTASSPLLLMQVYTLIKSLRSAISFYDIELLFDYSIRLDSLIHRMLTSFEWNGTQKNDEILCVCVFLNLKHNKMCERTSDRNFSKGNRLRNIQFIVIRPQVQFTASSIWIHHFTAHSIYSMHSIHSIAVPFESIGFACSL